MSSDNLEFDKETYKALYDFQSKQLDLIKERYAGLENKAAKYLTFVALIITALGLFSKEYIFSEGDAECRYLYFVIIFLIVLIFLSLCVVARFLFLTLRVETVAKLDTSLDTVKIFTQHELHEIYHTMAKRIVDVINLYEYGCNIKVDYLKRSFKEIKFCGLLLVLTVLLIIIDSMIKMT